MTMGEIADAMIDEGMEEWAAHQLGNCIEQCRFCEEEYLDECDE